MKNRIEYIDLAKGFCILLVVLNHVTEFLNMDYPFSDQIRSFRMPLYFILSGLFFKRYENFLGFAKRKTNKLLIPFLFFLIMTSLLPSIIVHKFVFSINYFINCGPMYNYPIWFLLCLFETNILFYVIFLISEHITSKHANSLAMTMTILFGIVGLFLSLFKIRIPLYIDTACTVLPFFSFGWWLNHHTNFLRNPFNLKNNTILLIVCTIILLLLAAPVDYSTNFISPKAFFTAHICGVSGTLLVLLIAKYFRHSPLISFWGRYSIMILCSHVLFITLFGKITKYFNLPIIPSFLLVFILTMTICHILIPVMKRYLPYVTAQKDLIKIES